MMLDQLSEILIAVMGSGGVVGVLSEIRYRRQNKRLKESEAKIAEINVDKGRTEARKQEIDRLLVQVDHQQKTIDTLMERNQELVGQLAEKENRHQAEMADKTKQIRSVNADYFAATEREKDHLRRENELCLELATKKCEDINCPFRQPPTANTPPLPNTTKEEYHLQKRKK